ncbi:MAG: CoA-binding protein [Anaerolineae bacterium]|nr:CoA-binding protein [Anaerolineae bacterium]
MYDFLRKVPLLANLPDEDLDRLCEMVREVRLPAGQDLFAEGSRGNSAYIIESGELEIIKTSVNRQVLLAVRRSGDVIGEMALLEDSPRSATVRARSDSVLYEIGQLQFENLLNNSPSASRVLLNTVLARWRAGQNTLRQSEKMAQLGTLTAGVAHELNNPAAAVKRGAAQLEETQLAFGESRAVLAQTSLSSTQRAKLNELAGEARVLAARPLDIDALSRSDQEYALEEWLDDHGVEDAWELAPTLVNLGYNEDQLTELARTFDLPQLSAVITWLGATYNVYSLLAEVSHGATRISEIVKALKSYVYLDQAPVQSVDIHEGLDNTLLILRSKLSGIPVRREYDPDLPKIEGYGSELNQVWTNILDNAADALGRTAEPEIIIRTRHTDGWISVQIIDNGPGIPHEIQARIFDAFFTTKPPGQGTGLGLDISYNIVVNKHRGDLKVFSQPGSTCFQIELPVNFEAIRTAPALASNDDAHLRRILSTAKTVAVVGISSRHDRPGYSVPAYLQRHGYRIIPVNPNLEEVLGERAYPDLLSIPEPVDVVEVFRRSEEVLPIVQQALKIGAKVIWMQEGIVNETAANAALAAGLDVVMDMCMRAAHRRLFGSSGE